MLQSVLCMVALVLRLLTSSARTDRVGGENEEECVRVSR